MSFWEKFKRKEVPQVKGLETHSSNSLTGRAQVSLQSFGLALLHQVASARLRQNVFISPLSIFLALAMTENGAAGETKAAMRKVLALPADTNDEAVNESAVALLQSLRPQGEAELAIANALWSDVKTTIAPDFVRLCQEIYDAVARTLDLSDPASAVAINSWVSDKTRGRIPSIVTAESIKGANAVLTNAVYFKGKFPVPFPKEATGPRPFYLADGRERVVPMMRKCETSDSYRSGKRFEAAVLRYQRSRISLYMVLPAKGSSPEEILKEETLQEMLITQGSFQLDLSMPRFTLDFSSSLKEPLTQLGMGIAFRYPDADFSVLGSPDFFLGDVIHKTRLEVDEEGTVAAAATSVMLQATSSLRPHRVEKRTLVFDRPFAVLLSDRTTGTILFAGIIYDP